jgi:hypothetical protein
MNKDQAKGRINKGAKGKVNEVAGRAQALMATSKMGDGRE